MSTLLCLTSYSQVQKTDLQTDLLLEVVLPVVDWQGIVVSAQAMDEGLDGRLLEVPEV